MARWILTALAGAALLIASPSAAQTLYWDALAGANNGVGGTATWGTTFSTTSTGDAVLSTAGATNPVIFQGPAGAVTLTASQSVASATFLTAGYSLVPDGGVHALSGNITLGNNVQLNLLTQTTPLRGLKIGSVTGGLFSSLRIAGLENVLLAPNANIAFTAPITITSSSGGLTADGGLATINASIANTSGSPNVIRLGATAGSTLNINGPVYGAPLVFAAGATGGAGTINLNAPTLSTHVTLAGDSAGLVKLGIDHPMPSAGLTMGASPGFGQTLDLNGHELIVTNLSSALDATGRITNNAPGSGTNTIKITGSGTTTFALPIEDGPTRKVALNYAGTGLLRLQGANTHTGGTTVTSGDLWVDPQATISATAPVTVAGGELDISGSRTIGPLTLSGGTISATSLTAPSYDIRGGVIFATLAGAGALAKSTAGTAELRVAATYTGGTTISAGTLKYSSSSASLANSGAVRVEGGTWDLNGFIEEVGPVTLASGTIKGATSLKASSFALESGNVDVTFFGPAALTKTTTGTVTFTRPLLHTGETTVLAGTLKLMGSPGHNFGLQGGGNLTVDGGTLDVAGTSNTAGALVLKSGFITSSAMFNGSINATSYAVESGAITVDLQTFTAGSGPLTKTTAGVVTLTGSNFYQGETTISAGILNADNASGSATGIRPVAVNGGTLAGRGAASGVVTVAAGAAVSPGRADLPASVLESLGTGAITFQSGSTFIAELNSASPLASAADLLNVSGALTINAGALLDLSDLASASSNLTLGDKLTLIRYSAAAWNGTAFDGYADDATFTLGDHSFLLNYNDSAGGPNFGGGTAGGNYVTLTVTAAPTDADFNGDGLVGGDDFLIWQRGLGQTGSNLHASGDADRNGVIDANDLAVWTNQFGPAPPATPTSAPVPEPTSALLVLITAVAMPRRRLVPSAATR